LGNVNASFSLAEYYLEEGPHQNIEEGLSYYKKAIDLGSPGAAFNLALICQNGILVTKNLEEAIKLFIIAAERGVYRGYGNIGAIYKERGDLKLAFKFFKLCAESKEANIVELDIFRARSQYELALMYKDGEGTMKDLVHSYAWASIAASDGEVRAEALVEDLKKIMDKDERREARELSRELYSKL
jgi:TPR repeat protein